MNKIIKNSDLIFDDGGKVTVDQYTSQEIKKAYVSIRIRYKSGRAADDKFFNKYELTSFDEKPFEELKDHKLKGILGVSTSNYNLSEWLVHRECLVVMPFDKFKELNDTEQIQYYDADYLSKNGFDALHRLFDRKERTDEDYTAILQRIFPKITQELQLEGMSMSQGSEYTNIYVVADWFNIYNSGKFTKYVANQKRINSPEELAQIVIDYANSEQSKIDYSYNRQTENLSIESIIQPIIRGIVQSGKVYVDESEWLIKNKELVIPENSQLFFVIKDYENMRDKYEEYISRYNLASSYKIAFINQKNLNELQSKRWNLKSERSKEEFEKAKTFTQKRIVKAIQKIQNDVIDDWTTKLIEEFKESYSNEVFKDYDGNSYSDNILEVPSAIIYFDSLMLKFIDIYDARVDYIAQTKSKYAFSDIFNDFSDYIDTLRSQEGEEELEVSTNYNRVYKYDILQKLYYYARHADYEKFGQKIKSEIGSDLYRYFSKDEVGFKKGGELKKTKMNKKILCPVGTEVQSLIFSKDEFTEKSSKDWAKNHDFKYGYIDEKENTYRIRQQEPSDFENMRTIEMTEGVKAVIGCPTDKYADGGAVGEIKIGDEVHARWNDSMQWTLGTFIGETENGFEVYNFKIEEPKYIEYYAQITKDGHNRKNNKIYESKNFKNRNYKNYNFSKYAEGGGVNISEARIQDAISRSNKKPEEILSEEVNTDTPKKLNRSEEVVPMSIINEIENEGISIERLESLGLPVYKYQTQITIHGVFEGLTKERVGGYKNLTLNQNKTLGVRYNAIDLEKKKLISNALKLDRFQNEDLASKGFRSRMDSKGFSLSKAKSSQDKSKALEYAKDFKEEANALPYNFIGGKYVNIYNVYGIYYVEYSIYLNAIRQDNLWGFISVITDGRIDEKTYQEILSSKESKEKEERADYEKELQERNRIADEKAKELKSQSPHKSITELPNSREFAIGFVQSTYGSADIKVYYIFYNKQNRRVFRKKTYKDWADVLPSISKEPTYLEKNLLMPDADLDRLNKKLSSGGYFLISEAPNTKIIDKKIEIKSEKPKDNTPLDSNDIYEFVETKHTKTGDTIYVLRIKKRLSPAEYKTVEANVKLIRGYYSGFVKGFVLKSKITKNEIERLFEGTSLAASELPKSKSNETLSGGKGDNKTIEEIAAMHNVTVEYAKEQLEKGIEIESEHTSDREKATEIAKDHLYESHLYYIELEKMEAKLEQEAEKTSDAPFKFEVGEYVMIIDEPISNNENIHRVVGHQNYNNTYGWETTIKNLYSDESVTMFENMLQISNKSEQIKEIINELKDSFSKIEQEDIDLHLKVRLDAIENESELEKAKENYPIVIEWSEGNITDNVGLNNLDELNSKLIEAGFSDRPTEIYIKNKVWFRNYPNYVRIDSSKQKKDFNFEKEHIRDWLKQSDSKFDWSVFDTKGTNQSEIEELEMLIELTQDAVNENPNDEELSLYLDVLKETLSDLKNK